MALGEVPREACEHVLVEIGERDPAPRAPISQVGSRAEVAAARVDRVALCEQHFCETVEKGTCKTDRVPPQAPGTLETTFHHNVLLGPEPVDEDKYTPDYADRLQPHSPLGNAPFPVELRVAAAA